MVFPFVQLCLVQTERQLHGQQYCERCLCWHFELSTSFLYCFLATYCFFFWLTCPLDYTCCFYIVFVFFFWSNLVFFFCVRVACLVTLVELFLFCFSFCFFNCVLFSVAYYNFCTKRVLFFALKFVIWNTKC